MSIDHLNNIGAQTAYITDLKLDVQPTPSVSSVVITLTGQDNKVYPLTTDTTALASNPNVLNLFTTVYGIVYPIALTSGSVVITVAPNR